MEKERPKLPSLPGWPPGKVRLPERDGLPGVVIPPRMPWEKEETVPPEKPPEGAAPPEAPPVRRGWETFAYEVCPPTKEEIEASTGLEIRGFEVEEEKHLVHMRFLAPLTLDERSTITQIISQKQPGPEIHGPAQQEPVMTVREAAVVAELKGATPAKIVQPLPTLDWNQIYAAIQLFDGDADVHATYDLTVAAAADASVTAFTVPTDRLYIARFLFEWGDACVKTYYMIDTADRVAIEEHYVAPMGQSLQLRKYLPVRSKIMIHYENTDLVNPAEFHVSMFQIAPRTTDWPRWEARIKAISRLILGES